MTKLGEFMKALQFAARRHRYQHRKSHYQAPVINHPINVARILATDCKMKDVELLQAAILHDTVEDTRTSFREIGKRFGDRVCRIVYDVTDDDQLPMELRKKQQIRAAKKACEEAKIIKLAEKLDNMRHMVDVLPVGWCYKDREAYFRHAKKVVDQLRGTSEDLEDELDIIFEKFGIS